MDASAVGESTSRASAAHRRTPPSAGESTPISSPTPRRAYTISYGELTHPSPHFPPRTWRTPEPFADHHAFAFFCPPPPKPEHVLEPASVPLHHVGALARRIHGWSWQAFPVGLGTGAVYLTLSGLNQRWAFFRSVETVTQPLPPDLSLLISPSQGILLHQPRALPAQHRHARAPGHPCVPAPVSVPAHLTRTSLPAPGKASGYRSHEKHIHSAVRAVLRHDPHRRHHLRRVAGLHRPRRHLRLFLVCAPPPPARAVITTASPQDLCRRSVRRVLSRPPDLVQQAP
jgi:hypothetical protein